MENLFTWLSSKVVPPAVIVLFLGSTVATSSLASMKLFSGGPGAQEVKALEQVPSITDPIVSGASGATGVNSSGSTKVSSGTTAVKGPSSTTSNGAAVNSGSTAASGAKIALTSTTAPQPNTGCIITLFGKQYDVTSLTTTHSGGNVFKCGTDMTATYQAQHGTNVSRMSPYLFASSSSGQGTGASSASGATGSPGIGSSATGATGANAIYDEDNQDEPESEDERERYIDERSRENEKQRLEEEREQAKQAAESEFKDK